MKKYLLICISLSLSLLLLGCGNKETKILCSMNGTVVGSIDQKVEATLDSNGKVKTIQIITYYQTEEEAKASFDSFKEIHKDNAILDGKNIIVKNAQDPNTLFGRNLNKTVGYTKEEFQEFLGNYTCE